MGPTNDTGTVTAVGLECIIITCLYVCIWFSDSVNLDNNAEAW